MRRKEIGRGKGGKQADGADLNEQGGAHAGIIAARVGKRISGALFVAKRLDGVEPGGVVGGVDAEEEADAGGDAEGDDD